MNARNKKKNPAFSMMRSFLATEAAGGVILIVAALAAMFVANSAMAPSYFDALKWHVGGLSVLHWINDGLMAIFFLVVGLEIKREVLNGQLSRWSDRILPGAAAIAGVIAPAAIFVALNWGDSAALRGWAIPTATDIAFALGVLALLGSRVPTALKIFLTAVAIIDDLIAVLIIAVFYTAEVKGIALLLAAAGLATLILFNRANVTRLWPYLVVGSVVWLCVLQSGIHATLAGVGVAMTIPLSGGKSTSDNSDAPLIRLEHALHPWVAFAIVPLFGFVNAGVSLAGFSFADMISPIPLGVALALFLGKQIGIFSAIWMMIRLGWAQRPGGAGWMQIYGVALLCGIGFTMSLFIGALAFGDGSHLNDSAKLGVLMGTFMSAIIGYGVLRLAPSAEIGR